MSLLRALLGFSVVVLTGCSRSDLSFLRIDDSPEAGNGWHLDAGVGPGPTVPEAAAPTPGKPRPPRPSPPKIPKPNKPHDAGGEVDGGILADAGVLPEASVPPDAGRCEVDPLVPGRLVGTWVWDSELAVVSWNTSNGTFTNQFLGVSGTGASLTQGPGELGIARIVTEYADGGQIEFVEMYRVARDTEPGAPVKSSVRVRADGARGVAVVWAGERYLLAWIDSTTVWIQRVSRDGSAEGLPQATFEGHPVRGISLASRAPGEVALLCEDYDSTRGAFFATLDGTGAPASAPVWVTGTDHSVEHRLVATRGGYAASYIQNTNDAFVTFFSPKGELVTRSHVGEACFSQWTCGPSSVALYGGSALASNGCEVALVYNVQLVGESRGLRLARLGEDGAVLESGTTVVDRKLTAWPRLGWDRAHGSWGVAWGEYNTRNVTYASVGSNGVAFTFQHTERGTFPTLGLEFVPD